MAAPEAHPGFFKKGGGEGGWLVLWGSRIGHGMLKPYLRTFALNVSKN